MQKERIVDVETGTAIYEPPSLKPLSETGAAGHFVTIMQGCDNFCTYCVVPYTRGRECSRQPEQILQEIEALVASGVKEITLLGQNVNSYGNKEGLCSFPRLLARVHDIRGLERIRFATSHPKDFSDDLIHSFQTLDKLCRHIHLPVQSGSSRLLKRMNRRYTREDYLHKIEKLRRLCPEVAVSSDMIVGFPGENRQDFEDTLSLIQTVEFDSLFAFAYSDRPNAPAARFSDKVSETEKKERLQILLKLQEEITLKKHQARVGEKVEILVEGKSKKQHRVSSESGNFGTVDTLQWTGRTSDNKIVNFNSPASDDSHPVDVGERVTLTIEKAYPHSLWGIMS
jgi:tRNA-2-methylthio-N6-dimethylallyladenosine synthase